jgi:hypothetical protein
MNRDNSVIDHESNESGVHPQRPDVSHRKIRQVFANWRQGFKEAVRLALLATRRCRGVPWTEFYIGSV